MYVVTKCCSESRMRSRPSRGVPKWSGGEDLYMGSPVSVTGKVSGFIGIVPGPPKGVPGVHSEGPPAPKDLMGCSWVGTSPLVGWCAPQGPKAPRVGNPRGPLPPPVAGAPLVGNPKGAAAPPRGRRPPLDGSRGPAPSPLLLAQPSPFLHLLLLRSA